MRKTPSAKAARAAAGLAAPHNAAQERLILPLLGWADPRAAGSMAAIAAPADRMRLESEVAQLYDADVDVVTALVELYAAAEAVGDVETARLAERMIWHETSDVEVLYPAALMVGSSM